MSSASSTTSSTSSGCESPVAAPRRNYGDYEVTISDESRIELSSTASETSDEATTYAECYSVEADVKNEVIYDVSASNQHEVTVSQQSVEVKKTPNFNNVSAFVIYFYRLLKSRRVIHKLC